MLRAVYALQQGRASQALEQLQITLPHELGVPGSQFGFFGNLYLVYLRGMPLRAERQGKEAPRSSRKSSIIQGLYLPIQSQRWRG